MMNAEQLRETYNEYFSRKTNRWSSTNPRETSKIADNILKWLKQFGLSKEALILLDVGCGTGFFTKAFRDLNINSIGLDYSEVAIQKAQKLFSDISFIQMNGFDPKLNRQFDLIFCRGFSGFNTHDLNFVASWVNRYVPYLTKGGYFILGYSSDFSGKEMEGETVNHSKSELIALTGKVNADFLGMKVFSYLGWISIVKRWIYSTILGRPQKAYFYLFFKSRS